MGANRASPKNTPPSSPPDTIEPLLSKEGFDQWVQQTYMPWLHGDVAPHAGQSLWDFFKQGISKHVQHEYKEWLSVQGQEFEQEVKTGAWRVSLPQFLATRTSSRIAAQLAEASSESIIIDAKTPSKSVEVFSSEAAETDELSVSLDIHHVTREFDPVMQALKEVFVSRMDEGEAQGILQAFVERVEGQVDDSESGQEMIKALTEKAQILRLLKAQVEHSNSSCTTISLRS